MKFQDMMRMQLLLAGFAAVLLLPGAARAQQDVDPTIFDVNPAPQMNATSPVHTAQEAAPVVVAKTNLDAASDAIEVAQTAAVDDVVVFGLTLGSGLIAFGAIAIARRQRILQSAS